MEPARSCRNDIFNGKRDLGVFKSNGFNFCVVFDLIQGGIIRWMGPEILDLEKFGLKDSCLMKASDCYALGMVIYETVSGKGPFHEHAGFAVFTKVLAVVYPT